MFGLYNSKQIGIYPITLSSTNSVKRVQFSRMKLINDDDVRTMFLIFHQYSIKEPFKLHASLVKFVEEIQKD